MSRKCVNKWNRKCGKSGSKCGEGGKRWKSIFFSWYFDPESRIQLAIYFTKMSADVNISHNQMLLTAVKLMKICGIKCFYGCW